MHEYRRRNSEPHLDTIASLPAPPLLEAWEDLDIQYGLADMYDDSSTALTIQTVEEEYSAYVTAPISPKGTDLVKFWEVSGHIILLLHLLIFLLDVGTHISHPVCHGYGLSAYTSFSSS